MPDLTPHQDRPDARSLPDLARANGAAADRDRSGTARRRFILGLGQAGLLAAFGAGWSARLANAQSTPAVTPGPAMRDIAPQQLSAHVWMIFADDGFPTPRNQGMMSNLFFVVTRNGVVVLDSGSSLQIGQMAIRMIRSITPKPVIAVFNSHFHGDHWLGNQAFAEAFGNDLPIYALQPCIERIQSYDGKMWLEAMEQWTEHATAGTVIVPPNQSVVHGQTFSFGDVTLRMHFYGHAHTPADLCVEVVEDQVTQIGDIAMGNRIANMDDGSYPGTFRYFDALASAAGEQLWMPGHGQPGKDLLVNYGNFLKGIWETCVQAVEDGTPLDQVKALVLSDPRVAARSKTMQGFDDNIGKYTSLAYLEAEREAF